MRKTPRLVQLVLAERLAHLDGAAWASLTRDAGIFLDARYLSSLERAGPANVRPRYALMYQANEPIAALALQLAEIDGANALNPTNPSLKGVAKLVRERSLVLGSLTAWGSTALAMKPGTSADLVWSEALSLVDNLRRFERANGHINLAALKDVGEPAAEVAGLFRQRHYRAVDGGPDMVLNVDAAWGSFDGYVASFNSKRRRALKKTCLDVEAAGFTLRALNADEIAVRATQLEALYGQVWSNAEVRPCRLPGHFFVELKRSLGEDFALLALERDGVMHGFASCLRSGSTCVAYYLGYDKTVQAPLYLRLLIADIEQAFAWRSSKVSLGRTAEEPKKRLGALPVASTIWVKHRVPPLNWAMGAVFGAQRAGGARLGSTVDRAGRSRLDSPHSRPMTSGTA